MPAVLLTAPLNAMAAPIIASYLTPNHSGNPLSALLFDQLSTPTAHNHSLSLQNENCCYKSKAIL
jgi:hypothetical protein